MNIITRKEAIKHGLLRYFTGKPCKRNHVAERRVSNRICTECTKGKRGDYAEGEKEYKRKYYLKNRERALTQSKVRYEANKPAAFVSAKAWRSRNPGAVNAITAARRADIDKRTPSWADLEAIKFFYECCPAGCHVDHIIPLHGKTVSGLHIAENLQWLPASENMKKSNKF